MALELCVSCGGPLLLEVPPDSSDDEQQVLTGGGSGGGQDGTTQQVVDDVKLGCGCHFHWECFLESPTITQCPSCERDISSLSAAGQQQVLVTVQNEGGTQEGFDILPTATEEAYLRAYPEERRGHAFLEFVREGDLETVAYLSKETQDEEEEDEDEEDEVGDEVDVLKYCGTFEGIEGTALHVAIRYQREEIAWLLLALGSSLGWEEFPDGAVEVLKSFGLDKRDRRAEPDIRSLKDGEGRTSLDLAGQLGGVWTKWVQSGKLNP